MASSQRHRKPLRSVILQNIRQQQKEQLWTRIKVNYISRENDVKAIKINVFLLKDTDNDQLRFFQSH